MDRQTYGQTDELTDRQGDFYIHDMYIVYTIQNFVCGGIYYKKEYC